MEHVIRRFGYKQTVNTTNTQCSYVHVGTIVLAILQQIEEIVSRQCRDKLNRAKIASIYSTLIMFLLVTCVY